MNPTSSDRRSTDSAPGDWLDVVRQNAANLKFGSIQITVHEGRVTQVESIEKTRFVAIRDETPTSKK